MNGVYKITNTVNGKVYIGSTTIGFETRWSTHRNALRSGKHYNKHLQRAWDKYSESAFTFEVVETATDKSDARAKELSWISKFFGKNCYNATTQAAGRMAQADKKPRKSYYAKKPRGLWKRPSRHIKGDLSLAEAFKVQSWLQEIGFTMPSKDLWRKRPSEIAAEYQVKVDEVVKAAGRE